MIYILFCLGLLTSDLIINGNEDLELDEVAEQVEYEDTESEWDSYVE
jgi:hypothetical protein